MFHESGIQNHKSYFYLHYFCTVKLFYFKEYISRKIKEFNPKTLFSSVRACHE